MLTLALGLGANVAMFSVIRAVLLRPLPYESPDALVKIVGLDRETGEKNNLSPADFLDFARETRTLQRVGAHGWIGFFTIADGTGSPERVGGVNVTEGFFPRLGRTFVLGRSFTTDEDAPNGPRVVILSHGFWQRRFGGDRTIVGPHHRRQRSAGYRGWCVGRQLSSRRGQSRARGRRLHALWVSYRRRQSRADTSSVPSGG